MATTTPPPRVDVEALLIEVADVLNTTLDLDTLLQRVAEVVKRVIDYEIFSILLLNERTQELRFRFQIGHLPEVAVAAPALPYSAPPSVHVSTVDNPRADRAAIPMAGFRHPRPTAA